MRRGNDAPSTESGQIAEQTPQLKQAEMSVAPKRWSSG
jgi:hypothetical protein